MAEPVTPSPGIRGLRDGVWIALLAAAVFAVIQGFTSDRASVRHTEAALGLATVAMAAILLTLSAAAPSSLRRFGWTGVLLGADGRISTSKVQVWLWTLGFSYAALFLAGIAIFRHAAVFVGVDWNDYVILIGGPFAAAVLAKQAVVTKLANGTLAKPGTQAATAEVASSGVPTTDQPSLSDVVSSDGGETDVFDTQYLVLNLVAFVYAAGVFIAQNFDSSITDAEKYALPSIPAVLLGLTSTAAATYVGNKATRSTTPRISSVRPSAAVAAGVPVTVFGVNLVPSGVSAAEATSSTAVLLTSVDAAGSSRSLTVPVESAEAHRVIFTMPPAFALADIQVAVQVADGRVTEAWPISAAL